MDGYRRNKALAHIAAKGVEQGNFHPITADLSWDARQPTILAIVQLATEYEARERNLTAATTGSKLTAPDLAYGIEELRLAAKKEGRDLNGNQIAALIGKSPALVSSLLKIHRLPKKITRHWRECGKITLDGKEYVTTAPAQYKEMLGLAEVGHDEVEKEYAKIVGAHTKTDRPKSPEGKKLESAMKRAASIGELIGYLAFVGIDPQKLTKGEWLKIVQDCVGFERPGKKEATDKQLELLTSNMAEAYKQEKKRLAKPEDGDDDKTEEATQAKRDKRDGGR